MQCVLGIIPVSSYSKKSSPNLNTFCYFHVSAKFSKIKLKHWEVNRCEIDDKHAWYLNIIETLLLTK